MTAILSARGLMKSFGAVAAADDVNIEIAAGQRVSLIGSNGAGKTTFVNMVTGYLKPDAGSVSFAGQNVTRHSPRDITRRGLGRSFQLPQVFVEHTVRECLLIAASAHPTAGLGGFLRPLHAAVDAGEVDATLKLIGLADRAHELASALPEGQRKLLDVAMALVLRPKLMIMDEPTSGVSSDEKHDLMRVLMRALDERGVTTIFVEHDIDIVRRHATRLAAWINGRIAADGAPETVLADPEVIRNVIGG